MSTLYFASLGRVVAFTLLTLSFSSPALLKAQDTSSMTGVVTDTTGAVLPNTTVILSNTLTGVSFTQTTNNQGIYHFASVPPNQGYTAVFSHDGFTSVRVGGIPLSVGITRTQDAKLAAGNTVVVDVSAVNLAVTLNTTDASIGNNISVQQLDELPVYDRTAGITTLFYQQPGVDSNQGAVTGARTDQTEVTVDGLDVNDIASNALFTIIGNAPVDSVQQFTGTVAGLVPAIGTGSGAQFQLVTKNGTNQFHGNINEYHRDTTTVANTWFNDLDGLPRTPLIRNQFGGNIGGPIKKDKLFFFFNFSDSRIIQSQTAEDIVPLNNITNPTAPTLNYINSGPECSDSSRINTQPNCITALSAAQVAALDPNGVGFDTNVLSYIHTRYPAANDLTQGDGVNTGGYRFTVPTPDLETNYVGRIDYNLTSTNRIFGRFTINRENAIETLPEFPTDPVTHPFIDRSYGYVVSDIWTIGKNKVNQFYYGDNISKFSFPDLYNPTGADQYSFASNLNSTILSGPYTDFDGQHRRVPIPVVRDDFNWQLGSHSIVFGGTFKFIKASSNLTNDFNFVEAGLQGSALAGGLDPSLRPSDIYTSSTGTALNDYDNLFAATLGDIGEISTNFDYTSKLAPVAPGTGANRNYRYFETEAYVGDTWKVNPRLTITYGLRYQLYSVPYETNGEESVEYFNTPSGNATVQNSTYNAYVKARLAQSASGNTSNTGLPIYQVELGGKANRGPNLYGMAKKDFAPRIAFSYNPQQGTVVDGGIGIVYDRTVINAINFLQDQISYLFANTINNQFPTSTQPPNSTLSPAAYALSADTRLGSNLAYDQSLNPVPAPLTVPYTPDVDGNGVPYGLAAGETNFIISPNLKDPYSIALNLGIQQDLPWHMIMKLNYSGRLGRRLLADADAGQVLDVPDYTGLSTQSMSAAFAGLTTQLRAQTAITPQPWFEDVLAPGTGAAYGAANPTSGITNNTQLVAALAGQLVVRGDISDSLQALATDTYYFGFTNFLPTNIGIPSQFGSNTYLTNQGNSNYHALLLTIDKNVSEGLRFEFNYTWSHSIDNTSLSSANNALYNDFGLLCDITKPRACRASSDFDVRQEITSNLVYDLPVGRGKEFLSTAPRWVDETIGEWAISAIPVYRTGVTVNPFSDAFLASFDNDEPAIFTGNKGDLKSHVNVSNGTVYDFAGGAAGAAKVLSEFRGPIGLEYGQRNLVYGPGAFFLDAGLAKKFPIIQDKVTLTFRADAFNVLNHPAFGTPALNIVTNTSPFGQITNMANEPGNTLQTSRVAQFSLRLEF